MYWWMFDVLRLPRQFSSLVHHGWRGRVFVLEGGGGKAFGEGGVQSFARKWTPPRSYDIEKCPLGASRV